MDEIKTVYIGDYKTFKTVLIATGGHIKDNVHFSIEMVKDKFEISVNNFLSQKKILATFTEQDILNGIEPINCGTACDLNNYISETDNMIKEEFGK